MKTPQAWGLNHGLQPLSKAKPAAAPQKTKPKMRLGADDAAADAVTRRIGVDPKRTESYRAGYARLMVLAYMLTFVIFGLIGLLVFVFITHVPEDSYFAETAEGARLQMVGLERPYVTQQALFDWAVNAATQVLTFGFNDYDDKLSAAQVHFTKDGWVSFAQVMANSTFFKNVVSERQLVTAVPAAAPTMMFEGIEDGKYSWVVEIPLMVTVRSGSLSRSLKQKVRMVIMPVPTDMNPMGIAIDRWISF